MTSSVRTTYQDYGIAGLSFDHFLGIHTHEISQVHARRRRERLMDANSGKLHGETSIELDPTLHGLDQLWDIGVARVEARVCINDAYDRSGECIFAIAHGLDEDLAQEEGEVRVTVGCKSLPHALRRSDRLGEIIVGI
jgi:hypothetical protein